MSAGAEFELFDRQRANFRHTETGLNGEEKQAVISTSGPGRSVRRPYEGVGLG